MCNVADVVTLTFDIPRSFAVCNLDTTTASIEVCEYSMPRSIHGHNYLKGRR